MLFLFQDSKCSTPTGTPIPTILLANKADLHRDPKLPTDEEISGYLARNGFLASWYKTSAKSGEGIQVWFVNENYFISLEND